MSRNLKLWVGSVVCSFILGGLVAGNALVQRYAVDLEEDIEETPQKAMSITSGPSFSEVRLKKAFAPDYDVDLNHEALLPQTQTEWDYEMKRLMTPTNAREMQVEENPFAEYRPEPEQIDRQLHKVNRRIELLEANLEEDPFSEELQDKLEDLFMLKATLMNLKNLSVIE